MNHCTHDIKINNYANEETVTYSIIKIIGTIDENVPKQCSNTDELIYVCKDNTKISAKVVNRKFKFIIELREGNNNIFLTYCSTTVNFSLQLSKMVSTYSVLPLYIICKGHDGRFQSPDNIPNSVESACRKIHLCSKLLQTVTAEKLYENNLGRKTFGLENSCQIFNSSLNYLEARKMNSVKLWEYFGREIVSSEMYDENKKYLCFLSCTSYIGDKYSEDLKTLEDLVKITEGYVALGGGGLALFGTACLYTWPETLDEVIPKFEDETPVDKSKFLDDSCYRGTLGACFSTTLGSVLHELYHTFNLGHSETGIMGRGFDDIYKVFNVHYNLSKHQEMSRAFHNKIEFKEEFEAEKLSERLQNEFKRKDFSIIKKFDEADDTYLNKSSAVFLFYHRWFNEDPNLPKSFIMTYDHSTRFIKSTLGIRVIEIRSESDEMVLRDWTFEGRVLKFSFQLPEEMYCVKNVILVAEDSSGNIIKELLE